jgi:hypothetical protein
VVKKSAALFSPQVSRNGCAASSPHEYFMLMAGASILFQFSKSKTERRFFSHLVCGSWLAASLLLSSCATPYKPLDHCYGYSEKQVAIDVYEVSFLGNGNTSHDRALDFAVLRAAEIALSCQAKSFTLLDVANLSSVRPYQTAPHFYWTTYPNPGAMGQTTFPALGPLMEPAEERVYYRPGVKLKVKLLPDSPGSYYPYDPAKESERLMLKYRIKPGKR